jgi:hypothetical protein
MTDRPTCGNRYVTPFCELKVCASPRGHDGVHMSPASDGLERYQWLPEDGDDPTEDQ